jgi:threonine-phosphate decarboxylase
MPCETLHGGRVHAAARELGLTRQVLLDASANLNPLGPPASVVAAIRAALPGALGAYPDSDAPDLRRALCRRHRIEDASLVLGPGGAALLHLALRALAPRRVLLAEPCFREQPRAVAAAGAEAAWHPMPGLHLDLEALDPRGCDAVLLTNPHNPTGQLLARDGLLAWVLGHPGLALILDEAFMDYHPDQSLAARLAQRPRTVVLRSLTKFYAMPGLRVGYGFADPATARRMDDLQESWPVGQLELAAALAAIQDPAYEQDSLRAFRADAPRFRSLLGALPGLEPCPGSGPFVLVRLRRGSGTRVAAVLALQGILVRTCAQWPGLGDRYLRLAVRGAADQDRLLAALAAALEGAG